MSFKNDINDLKLNNGGYDLTGFNNYAVTVQDNKNILLTPNYYYFDKKKCNYNGEWNDVETIKDCVYCVSNYGSYGQKQMFCNGKCMNKHSLGEVCSDGSLFATDIDQCFTPCYNSLPSTFGSQICNDSTECGFNEFCNKKGFCESDLTKVYYDASGESTEMDELSEPTVKTVPTVKSGSTGSTGFSGPFGSTVKSGSTGSTGFSGPFGSTGGDIKEGFINRNSSSKYSYRIGIF